MHTMSTVLDVMKARIQGDRRSSWRRYAELLSKPSLKPGEVDELQRLMQALDRSPDDMAQDLQILQNAQGYQTQIRQGAGLEAQMSDLQTKLAAHIEETRRILQPRNEVQVKLQTQLNELQDRQLNGGSMMPRLGELQRAHHELLSFLDE
jgi:hypothetical protein